MMYDLRNYKNVIKEAVKRESDADPNWNWKLLAVNRTEVRIGWGYTEWLGEKEPFRIKLDEFEWETSDKQVDITLFGFYPGVNHVNLMELDDAVIVTVGKEHWHDVHFMEDGLRTVIHSLVSMAHKTF